MVANRSIDIIKQGRVGLKDAKQVKKKVEIITKNNRKCKGDWMKGNCRTCFNCISYQYGPPNQKRVPLKTLDLNGGLSWLAIGDYGWSGKDG